MAKIDREGQIQRQVPWFESSRQQFFVGSFIYW